MVFSPFEVTPPHLAYAFLGGFVVIFGLFSLFIKERLYIGEAPIATIVGIIIGPHCLKLFDPYGWAGGHEEVGDEITLEVTRVIIALSVFAVGVELPKAYMKKHWRTLFFLLGPGMLWGWMVTGLLIWGLLPGHNFLSSLVIASCVTPTDPILAQAVIGGKFADKHVPAHIRHMLSAESGSNDGAAFPFLYIAMYLLLQASPGHAVGEWFYYTVAYEVILGIIIGAVLGFSVRKVMQFAERKKLVDRQSFVAQYVSLAILTIGISTLLGSDDLLSAFACGCAFAWDGYFNKATEDAVFSNVIDLLFNCAAFIYIGAVIPFGNFNNHELGLDAWRLVVLTLLVLLLRRLPIILACYKFMPDIKTFREACFSGWFGPIGVGAVFISTLARVGLPPGAAEKDTEQVDHLRETIGPIVYFLVLSSIAVHGLSIPFFSLGRRVHSITYTWSRNPSMDTRRDNEPAWTTHARRIRPGQEIRVNRDDDPEEGDIGVRDPKSTSTSDASSSTRQPEAIEMQERQDSDDADDGRRTPPLAEYREGDHLVRERRTGSGDEVEVEVLRNHFHKEKPTENSTFRHPRALAVAEVDKLHTHLPVSLEHAVSRVQDAGEEAVDRLGLGLIRSHSSTSRTTSPAPEATTTSPTTVYVDPSRLRKNKPTLRQRLFGKLGQGSKEDELSDVEEGKPPVSAYITRSRSAAQPVPIIEPEDDLRMSRTASKSIRFAPEAVRSSDTAPSVSNYGNSAPGFRRNPELSMFRSASVRSEEGQDEDGGR